LTHDRIVQVVFALREHALDEVGQLRKRLVGVGGEILLERGVFALPVVFVETRFLCHAESLIARGSPRETRYRAARVFRVGACGCCWSGRAGASTRLPGPSAAVPRCLSCTRHPGIPASRPWVSATRSEPKTST